MEIEIEWTRAEDGRAFNVAVHDASRERLVLEMKSYYAVTNWERKGKQRRSGKEVSESVQRLEIQRERRARWAARVRSSEF